MSASATDSVAPRRGTTVLKHLTGPARGTATWLSDTAVEISLSDGRRLVLSEPGAKRSGRNPIARLHRDSETYEIEAVEAFPIWVNGQRIAAKRLQHRDLIEFGDTGPLSRFEIYGDGSPVRKSIGDILSDCVDYVRVSRKPPLARIACAVRDVLRGVAQQTSKLFRLSVVTALVVLAALVIHQNRSSIRLQEQLESDAARLKSVEIALSRARDEALRPKDLHAVREELSQRLSVATERLTELEARSGAGARVIASAAPSIVFLQGAYGLKDVASNRMLRQVVDDEGRPFMMTLEGDGPVVELQHTGTAFVVNEDGAMVTNRHVALPWEDDERLPALLGSALQPVLIRFIGFLPGIKESFDVALLQASDDADLAILVSKAIAGRTVPLTLAQSRPEPGNEVIVMGYPTGLRAMLAQTGTAFIDALEEKNQLDFWLVAAKLSEAEYIRPLASRGIVGQVSAAAVVYDADTTHGGSGGPVLDLTGKVVAVNTAIIPEYGGSNLGIPADLVKQLLQEAGVIDRKEDESATRGPGVPGTG